MAKTNRVMLVPLLSIVYVPISVYFYGKGRTGGGEPLYINCWSLLWFPMVAFNAWAIASVLPLNAGRGSNWIIGFVIAAAVGALAAAAFMAIAFNTYGS
jgi:hypothetical protein